MEFPFTDGILPGRKVAAGLFSSEAESPIPPFSAMPIPASLRSLFPLASGLVVGGVGATMFLQSMPGAEGSPEARAAKLEVELKKAQDRITRLEAKEPAGRTRPGQTFADKARTIAEDIRAGRPVNPEDIFRAAQPLLRDMAPLFDRMRLKQQREMVDRMTGEFARKYDLSPEGRETLRKWFDWKMNMEAKRWTDLMATDGIRIQDMMRASKDIRVDEGLEPVMAGILPPEKLATFTAERKAERAQKVQQEADMKVQRLDGIVKLDDSQRERVFGIMARGSKDYEPTMILEGESGVIGATPGGDRQAAMLAVLRPEQRAAYAAEQKRRRDEAEKNMEAVGLSLPPDWQMLDDRDNW